MENVNMKKVSDGAFIQVRDVLNRLQERFDENDLTVHSKNLLLRSLEDDTKFLKDVLLKYFEENTKNDTIGIRQSESRILHDTFKEITESIDLFELGEVDKNYHNFFPSPFISVQRGTLVDLQKNVLKLNEIINELLNK